MSPRTSRPGLLRRSVAARLWAGLILLALGLSALLGAAAWHSRQAQQAADARLEALAAKAETAQRWLTLTRSNVLRIEAVAASSDPVIEALYKDEIPAVTAAVNALQRELDALELGESDRRLMAAVAHQRQDMLSALARLRELKARQESAAARDWLMQRFRPAVAAYVAALEDFVNQQGLERREAQQQLAAARERAWWRLGAALAALLALLGLAAVALVRSIQQPLAQALARAQRIAAGQLDEGVAAAAAVPRPDEFGALLQAMDTMAQRLREAVGSMRDGADSVSAASAQIAQGNQDLSQRTEAAAVSVEGTLQLMHELAERLARASGEARQASSLAGAAAGTAGEGAAVVRAVVQRMGEIAESSQRVQTIVGLIDTLAFQTNILALNAAVEAARAGEQGRGFAVVAAEVRNLAQRSAEAAREIRVLIGSAGERVHSGRELVEQAGHTMQRIVEGVSQVQRLIDTLAEGAGQQHEGVSRAQQAVGQLDLMTQQNAALVEQSAAAAQSLHEQAQRLAGVAGRFSV